MKRGDLFRVLKPSSQDPKKFRIFVVVSRQVLIESQFSAVICAPVYTRYDGLSTQVFLDIDVGVKHECSIHCDELVSLPKTALTHFIGSLSDTKLNELSHALKVALSVE